MGEVESYQWIGHGCTEFLVMARELLAAVVGIHYSPPPSKAGGR